MRTSPRIIAGLVADANHFEAISVGLILLP